VGKGLDSTGAILLWVRRAGANMIHDLYRSTDGVKFECIATPKLSTIPTQITDIFEVPEAGLMSLWFGGSYSDHGPNHFWGTLTSHDNGITWKQTTIESKLITAQWPAEPVAVSLGGGKIIAIGRSELGDNSSKQTQIQMVSSDFGVTWKCSQTNISDIYKSTASLIFDAKTGLLSNYYYHRGKGVLKRIVVDAEKVFDNPLSWPASEAIAVGSQETFDAGNANATVIGNKHFVSFYSGKLPNTSIFVSVSPSEE